MYRKYFKRALDLILSTICIVVFSPLLLAMCIAIRNDSKGSILFKQKRNGINKCTFIIYKFRTMKIDTPPDTPTHMLDDPLKWITKVGKVLRKTSLDELPQLFNIVRGEMSFVGPRPALWNQYDLINEREKYSANNVRPGLTGRAQINGRDELSIEDKAKLDGEYIKRTSLLFDCRCIIGTAISVIHKEGVVEGNNPHRIHLSE
jgi:O-antigen biosynthesis protein WbqP